MRKSLETLAPGDWVVLESLLISRHISRPWQVASIAGARVYIERHEVDHVTKKLELVDKKYCAKKSIKFAFTDKVTAEAAEAFSRANSDEYERLARELQKDYTRRFNDYMNALPMKVAEAV